jgi:hypothetical protein
LCQLLELATGNVSGFLPAQRSNKAIARCPLAWVMSAEIRYLEITSSGVLRHAMFRQLGGRWT